ncbi:MAG: helix-turn-helix transcriptional regulator [Lactobacillus delbrueckii]
MEAVFDEAAVEARMVAIRTDQLNVLRELVTLRKRHSLSQEQVAERMAITQPAVAAVERYGSNPTMSTIRRYAVAVEARIETTVIDDCQQPHDKDMGLLLFEQNLDEVDCQP